MISEFVTKPWPWWIAGPAVGITVPLLLLVSSQRFGISSSFRHICAAVLPSRTEYLSHAWRQLGGWTLVFAFGLLLGGALAMQASGGPWTVAISAATVQDLAAMGIAHEPGLVPPALFSWGALASVGGLVTLVLGGFLVGFGARYADGCTSGHAITGLATLQPTSVVAVLGFFAGGLLAVHVILPAVLR